MNAQALKKAPATTAPDGKQRLINAALTLGAKGGSLSTMGIRELAREAGLNHNTFYRHFDNLEDLALELAKEVAQHIMQGLKQVRAEASRHADATHNAARYFLRESVAIHPNAYRVGLRELYGSSTAMRQLLRDVLEEIADSSVEQIQENNLVPGLETEALREAALNITYYMLGRSIDYLENPERVEQIEQEIVRYVRTQFMGSLALQKMRAN